MVNEQTEKIVLGFVIAAMRGNSIAPFYVEEMVKYIREYMVMFDEGFMIRYFEDMESQK